MQNEANAERFIGRWEQFMTACDALEWSRKWNKELYGEMEAYYENDIVSILLRIIASDGRITSEETEQLNKCYGFSYTNEELQEVCDHFKDEAEDPDSSLLEGYSLLKSVDPKLAEFYAELVVFACSMIVESDGALMEHELREANHIIFLFNTEE